MDVSPTTIKLLKWVAAVWIAAAFAAGVSLYVNSGRPAFLVIIALSAVIVGVALWPVIKFEREENERKRRRAEKLAKLDEKFVWRD